MKAAIKAWKLGFRNLTHVSENTGVSVETLIKWSESRPKMFDILLAGCVKIIEDREHAEFKYNQGHGVTGKDGLTYFGFGWKPGHRNELSPPTSGKHRMRRFGVPLEREEI